MYGYGDFRLTYQPGTERALLIERARAAADRLRENQAAIDWLTRLAGTQSAENRLTERRLKLALTRLENLEGEAL